MSDVHSVAVVGASGYTGLELLRILLRHPQVRLAAVTSRANAGQRIGEVFPRFEGFEGADLRFGEPDMEAIEASGARTAFLALPHGMAAEFAVPLLERGLRVIDLSADFRIRDAEVYADFYDQAHPAPELLKEAVYGLPEVYREEIKVARLVAAPGCYPTSVLLPLIPLLREGLVDPGGIAVSSMSGVSGAGRKAALPLIFPEVNESVRSYGLPRHRHLSEIEQELSVAAGEGVRISFVPHLVPVTAGICTTIFAELKGSGEKVVAAFERAFAGCPFVRFRGEGHSPDTKNVVGTNFIDIGFHHDSRTGRIILQSAEDNLRKGAGGQAVQSFNLIYGLPETAGLLTL